MAEPTLRFSPSPVKEIDVHYMRLALKLARNGFGLTSPNPMVGALLVKNDRIIGRGWHHRAGEAHAEIAALRDCAQKGQRVKGATLYVSLEPCSTHGRTPPCTEAIIASDIKRVVMGATDPNPRHCGRGLRILQSAGVAVASGVLAEECGDLNEAFNHWIVHRTPFVTVKAAMTLDGKIATSRGESKWITGEQARTYGMRLRQGADAILLGINTILADDPSLTVRKLEVRLRKQTRPKPAITEGSGEETEMKRKKLRRIILDINARTPLDARVVSDDKAALTTIVVGEAAPQRRIKALAKRVRILCAPTFSPAREFSRETRPHALIDLPWLLQRLGSEDVTSLLIEGGGEVNASFLLHGLAQRVAFFYAPKILGGRNSHRSVAGLGARSLIEVVNLTAARWRRLGPDWFLTARVGSRSANV